MKEFYTVGEVSKLFNVSTETLRYYDRIQLIKPWKKGGNGYRYYSKAQFEMISTIIVLRTAGTSIEKLQSILNQDNPHMIQMELQHHRIEIRQKIEHLKSLETRVDSLFENIRDVSTDGLMEIRKMPKFWIISKEFAKDRDELEINEIVRINKATSDEWISFANIFSTIEKNGLLTRNYHRYKSYGFISEYPCETKSADLSIVESRLYACANARILRIDLEDIDRVYDNLIKFIDQEGFTIDGEAIERNVLDLFHGNNREFIHYFKIYIPVKRV